VKQGGREISGQEPAAADPGPGRDGLADVTVELFRRRLVIERAHSGGRVEGVAEPHALGRRRDYALYEFPADSCVDIDEYEALVCGHPVTCTRQGPAFQRRAGAAGAQANGALAGTVLVYRWTGGAHGLK
jgi:hypothetical protein